MNNIVSNKLTLSVIFLSGFCCLTACENGIVGTGDKPTQIGIAQKGPFKAGSVITIVSHPGPDYAAGDTQQVVTLDDIGTFEYKFEKDSVYDISISGLHFNEVSGELSATALTLNNTYYHESDGKPFVGVNILTHLIHLRIKYLLAEELKKAPLDRRGPAAITTQARSELLTELRQDIFATHLRNISFSNMSVYDLENTDTTANAVLLFMSAAFYQLSSSTMGGATMDETLTAIALDLELDGKIEGVTDQGIASAGTTFVSSLDAAARQLNPDRIRNNLTELSITATGKAIPVPDISFLLDNDGDGITNDFDQDDDGDGIPDSQDPKPYEFEIVVLTQTLTIPQGTSTPIPAWYQYLEHPDSNPTFSTLSEPQHGRLDRDNLTYTPNSGFTGEDSISVSVTCAICQATGFNPYTSQEGTITFNVVAE